MRKSSWLATGLAIALVTAMSATSAWAGRIVVTGHDADFHCSSGGSQQCHFFRQVIEQVRATAPNPGAPILIVDKKATDANEVQRAITNAYGSFASRSAHAAAAVPPSTVIDPADPNFAAELGGLSTTAYSALVVASDSSCGGCDLNGDYAHPDGDTQAINAVEASTHVIRNFFTNNGGVVFFAGANHGDGSDPAHNDYYNAVPVQVTGIAVTRPFTLTPAGTGFGLFDSPPAAGHTESDINCCATHNSFGEPSGPFASFEVVLERDSAGKVETLFGDICYVGDTPTRCPSKTVTGPVGILLLPPAVGPKSVIKLKIPTSIPSEGNVVSGKVTVFEGGAVPAAGKGRRARRSKTFDVTPGGVLNIKPASLGFIKRGSKFTIQEVLVTDLNLTVRLSRVVKLNRR